MSLNDIFCAPSHTSSSVVTARRVASVVEELSSIHLAARPNAIAKTIIGRNCPLASAANGFWKRLATNAPNDEPAPAPPAASAFAPSMPAPATFSAASIFGFIRYAIATPNTVAKTDVPVYHASTSAPTFPDLLIGSDAAPRMSEKRITGYTTIFSIATSTAPNGNTNGTTFFTVSGAHHALIARPTTVPSTNPVRIFATSGIFFMPQASMPFTARRERRRTRSRRRQSRSRRQGARRFRAPSARVRWRSRKDSREAARRG